MARSRLTLLASRRLPLPQRGRSLSIASSGDTRIPRLGDRSLRIEDVFDRSSYATGRAGAIMSILGALKSLANTRQCAPLRTTRHHAAAARAAAGDGPP